MTLRDRLVTGLARKIGSWPLKVIGLNHRAEVLESVSEETIHHAEIPGGSIGFYAFTPHLLWRAGTVLSKEVDTIQWIEGFEEAAVFWDIGANMGVFSLYAAVRRKVSVLAFEPSAPNFHVLSRNIQLNRLCDRVTAYCVALAKETQLGVLNMSSASMGASLSQFGRNGEGSPYADRTNPALIQGMVGYSIDDFVAQFKPPFPTYIKIDVDGLELPILEGACATLRDPRVKSLIVELNLDEVEAHRRALSLLENAGFRLVGKGEIQATPMAQGANHLFVRA